MNTALLTGYILAVTALLITPGPVMALVTATAARSGYLSAFRTILGTHLASLILIFLAVLMLAGIVSLDPSLLSALGIAGACYLGFTAIQSLRSFHPSSSSGGYAERGGFVRGFITAVASPKDILFFLTFFPQFRGITADFHTSMAVLCGVWVILDFLMLSLHALVVSYLFTVRFRQHLARCTLVALLIIALCSVIYNALSIMA